MWKISSICYEAVMSNKLVQFHLKHNCWQFVSIHSLTETMNLAGRSNKDNVRDHERITLPSN